jgi:hypothetical protein
MGKTWNAKEHIALDFFPGNFQAKTKLETIRYQLYSFSVCPTAK